MLSSTPVSAVQFVKNCLVKLGPRNPLVRTVLRMHARQHGFHLSYSSDAIRLRRGQQLMVLNQKQFVQVPIMLECFDLFFASIRSSQMSGMDLLDFSKPQEWSRPLGTMVAGQETGSVSVGGPINTPDLIFSAATVEPLLRAFDKQSGAEVWKGALPAPAQSTPMTYLSNHKQFIVVCAGGHGAIGTPQGDAVVAFSLN
jgi:glucose dehydrogenase